MTEPLPLAAVNAFLLDLHRSCHDVPLRAFQEQCFERMKAVVPFDSGLLAIGTLQRGIPVVHDFHLHRQSAAMMASWEKVKHLDVVAARAMAERGRTHRFVAEEVFADAPAMLAHCRDFGLDDVLCTGLVAERAGGYFALSIYRNASSAGFREVERQAIELLVPHVEEAMRQAKLEELRRATQTARKETQSAAIANRSGLLLEAEPPFIELLAETHPSWSGPWLPPPRASLVEAVEDEQRPLGRLVFRVSPREDLVLLHARRAHVIDALTERERQVARLFASGESTKGVADELAIAPNTVRVHIGRVYEKLGVVNKAELASMLAAHD